MAGEPSVDEMLKMKFSSGLLKWCRSIGEDGNLDTANDCHKALLKYFYQQGRISPQEPLFSSTLKTLFQDYDQRRNELGNLVDKVHTFVKDDKYQEAFEKLNLQDVFSYHDFDKLKKKCSEGKPSILVAGSTSSGKSTLLNALLGEDILLTDHNAATAVLCKVKHSEDDKFALVHFEGDQERERLDLHSNTGRQQLESYIKRDRTEPRSETRTCSFVEIFWPKEFLKYVTLVDSPGTTDDSFYHEITSRYQKDLASGFIYVVNATDPVERARQVGKLMQAVADPDGPNIARSAVFVVNKWDMLCRQIKSEEGRKDYLVKLCGHLAKTWIGFKESDLLTMNARISAEASKVGVNTEDVKKLCLILESLWPQSMKGMITKTINELMKPMRRIENQLENTIRELNLPIEERKKKQSQDMAKIQGFRDALKECQKKLDEEIDKHIPAIYQHLETGEGRQAALSSWTVEKYRSSKDDRKDSSAGKKGPSFEELLKKGVLSAIEKYQGFQDIAKWADQKEVEDELREIVQRYTSLTAELNQYDDSLQEHVHHQEEASKLGRMSKFVRMSKLGLMVAVGIPVTALFLAFTPLQFLVGSVWLPSYAYRTRKMQSSLQQEYDEFVKDLKKDDYLKLKTFVREYAAFFSQSIDYVYKRIPKEIEHIEEHLQARLEREHKDDLPKYSKIFAACQPVKESLAEYMAKFGIHDFHESDLIWPTDNPLPAGHGASSYVFQAQIMCPRGSGSRTSVAVKVLHPQPPGFFNEFLKEREQCRKFDHRNLVRFYGSVEFANFQSHGWRLALLFDWCDNKSLSDTIFGDKYPKPVSQPQVCNRAKEIMLQLTDGLAYLHKSGIVHRDIKPENILLDRNKCVKIADMGLVKSASVIKGTTRGIGSPGYVAPEIQKRQPYSFAADIYSLGVVLLEIWFGERSWQVVPTTTWDETPLRDKITGLNWSQHDGDNVPGNCWKGLTLSCCEVSPDDRPTAEKLKGDAETWDNLLHYYRTVVATA